MRPVDPTCPVCAECVDGDDDAVLVYDDGEDAVCDHCETFLTCKAGAMVVDYEEDHHRLSKEIARLRETLAHARRTLAHAMRLAHPPGVG